LGDLKTLSDEEVVAAIDVSPVFGFESNFFSIFVATLKNWGPI
jgi:hypothetical protein